MEKWKNTLTNAKILHDVFGTMGGYKGKNNTKIEGILCGLHVFLHTKLEHFKCIFVYVIIFIWLYHLVFGWILFFLFVLVVLKESNYYLMRIITYVVVLCT